MGCLFDDDDDPSTDKIVRCIGYELTTNLNFSGSSWTSGRGWKPIGISDPATEFTATFDGNDNAIANLYINRTETSDFWNGLFGLVGADAEIGNVRLLRVNVTGHQITGGLVGNNKGTITNSQVSGTVSGQDNIGGLVGVNQGPITNSHASVVTSGWVQVGGLVASNFEATISSSYATGAVSGWTSVGGLVGLQQNGGTIIDSHATGKVTGTDQGSALDDRSTAVGGLVGSNVRGTISNSYATGTVSSDYANAGGLVGKNSAAGTVRTSHARGAVAGNYAVGGLVGFNAGAIRASYATGDVKKVISGAAVCCFGGLVGQNEGDIDVSYATGKVADQFVRDAGGLVGINDGGTIRASYARGNVTGVAPDYLAGGLIGRIVGDSSTVIASYATGKVTGASYMGGLLGFDQGTTTTFTASYWDTETSGVMTSAGGTGKTTSALQTPTDYTDSDPNTEDIYADWNLNVDDDLSTGDPTTGADDPWDFGTTSQYPVLQVDFSGDGAIDAADIDPQRVSPRPPSPPPSSGNGGGSTEKSSSGGGGRAPSPPPAPTRSPIIGSTSAATAVELAGDLLVLQRHDQPGVEVEVGIGWMSQDGQRIIAIGFVRDGDLGQTYAVVRREGDGQVVRRWIAPDSPLVYAVPWASVNTQYTFPVGVILAIPLDDQYPPPNMLTRRFDGGDDRILAYDAGLGQWRHVPDLATFQAHGYYWCNVTAADAGFFDRITLGPPYPASNVPARSDYPVCRT